MIYRKPERCWDAVDQLADREAVAMKQAMRSTGNPHRRHVGQRDEVQVIREGRNVFVLVGGKRFAI